MAPLYREGADKRWVRRMRASGFLRSNDVVVDDRFKVVVVNLGPGDKEIFFVEAGAGEEEEFVLPDGEVQGGGGSLDVSADDGQMIVIRDAATGGTDRRVTVHRSDGDPQLLPVGAAQDYELCEFM